MSNDPPSMEREKSGKDIQEAIVAKVEAKNKIKEEVKRFGVPEDPLQETPLPESEKPRYAPKNTDLIMKRVVELPFEIRAHEAKLFALTQKNDFINKRSNEIKEKTYTSIYNETIPGEQKYPDTVSQEKETLKRLHSSKFWDEKWAEIYKKVDNETHTMASEKEKPKKVYTSDPSRKAETTKRIYADAKVNELKKEVMEMVMFESLEAKPKYTSDKVRDIEVNNRVNYQEEYLKLMSEQKEVIAETHRTKADIHCLRGEFKSIEIVTELMKIKLRIT